MQNVLKVADESVTIQTATYAVYALCRHPKALEPLRDELESSEYSTFVETAQGLPLLDSFIKESARMSPADSSKFLR